MKTSVAAVALALTAVALPAQTVKDLALGVRDSVVQVIVLDASGNEVSGGTGFVVGPKLVATNEHVVDGALRVRIAFSNGRTVEAHGVAAEDAANDLALLSVPDTFGARPLELSAAPVEPGDRVVVVGNPLGLSGTISEGIVAAVRLDGLGGPPDDLADRPVIQITAPISPGSSGSPVVNDAGAVIGVAVGHFTGGQNVNFAIPSRELIALRKVASDSRAVRALGVTASRGTLLRNLGISALVFAALIVAFRRMKVSPADGRPEPKLGPPAKIRFRKRPGWGE